jgi:hypothetical protein
MIFKYTISKIVQIALPPSIYLSTLLSVSTILLASYLCSRSLYPVPPTATTHLDVWLKLNGSCPVCRNLPLLTPLSTPLSEVVPLLQYAADRRRRR